MKKRTPFLVVIYMLMLMFTTNAFAQNGKKVSLNANKISLPAALAKVEQQSEYYKINYNYDELSKYTVTANIRERYAPDAVTVLLAHLPFTSSVSGKFITIKKASVNSKQFSHMDQKRGVSGRVTDNNGDPLIGATVNVPGTNKMAVTDEDGNFNIPDANPNDEIVISYIGKKTLKRKAGNKRLNIIVDDDDNLVGEVIVTGYQDIQKSKMTGSAVTISSAKLDERYTPNIMDNLEGRVAGLSTYGGKLTIRGTSSLYAEASPLLVVDGLPIEGSIEDLNPYDIESVNVLKDAAATAIYGARASNGIIVITTKNAKEKGKINIDFTSNLTVYEKRNMDYNDNFYMNAEQQVGVESAYWNYYFFNNEGEVSDPTGATESKMLYSPVSPIQYAYYQLAKGQITQDQLNSKLESLKKNNYAKEYADNIMRRQVMQQYNLALRSRSDKSSQNLILNYKQDNTGMVNAYDREFNISYKGIFDIAKWLTATVNVNGIIGRSKESSSEDVGGTSLSAWRMPAYMSLYDENGDYEWCNTYFGSKYSNFEQNSAFNTMRYNPLEDLYENTLTTKRQNLRLHGSLLFRIIDGLTAETQFVYENSFTNARDIATANSFKYRQLVNGFVTQNSSGQYEYPIPNSGGMMRTTNANGDYWTWRGQLNYNKTFGKHAINALAGLEFRETLYKGEYGLMLGYDDQLQNSSTALINYKDLSTQTSSTAFYNGNYYPKQFGYDEYIADYMQPITEVHHRYASGYFNVTYTYDERYNVFASFRKDYADVYGLNVKFRGKPLWSVGGAWNINNESFIKPIDWINILKLRFSYGVTGNIYQGATSYMTAAVEGNNRYTMLPYATVESPANPELKWEQTRTTNVGIDFSFIGNRLRGSLDWYHKVGKDLFSYKTLDPSTGFTSMFMNAASMKNDGIELQLTYDWYRSANPKGFSWTTTYTASYNKNKITSVENDATRAYELTSNPYVVGYPQSALWSYQFAGIDSETNLGQTLWLDSDGIARHNAQGTGVSAMVYSGQSEPKTIMGLDNTWRYYGFSLSILMAYYGGHKMRCLQEVETFGMPFSSLASYFLNAWTPENPTNTPGIGRYGSNSLGSEPRYSDISVRSADFVKIRNIVLGYEFPKTMLRNLGINRLALRFQIDNPKYLWVKNSVHVDPETLGVRNPSAFIFGLNINL